MDRRGYRFGNVYGGNSEKQALIEISNRILFKKLEPEYDDVVEQSKKIIGTFTIVTSEEMESVARAIAAAERGMRGGTT